MNIAVVVASIVLVVYLGVAAILNIFYLEEARKNGQRLHLSRGLSQFIGWCQLAGAIGLLGGLFWRPLGIAAAIGFLLMMVGAVIAHVRVRDSALASLPAVVVFGVTAFVFGGQVALLTG